MIKKIKKVKKIREFLFLFFSVFLLFLLLDLLPVTIYACWNITAFGLSTNSFINKSNKSSSVQICYLDNYDNNLQKINKEIHGRYYIDHEGVADKYQSRFKVISDSYLCRYQAKLLGIKKLPAIVFSNKNKENQKYVVYGEQDIKKAIEEYQAYERRTND